MGNKAVKQNDNKTKIFIFSGVAIALVIAVISVIVFSISSKPKTYEIEFIVQDEIYYTIQTSGNEKLELPNKPQIEDYDFVGWYFEDEFVTEFTEYSYENKKLDNDITVYAKFETQSYTITYELNGGVNNSENISGFNKDTEFTFKAPTKIGFTFNGWYKESNFNTQVTSIQKNTTNDITVYAKWDLAVYTIAYELDGGINNDAPTTYTIETEYIFLNPTKVGYTFKGWFTDSNYNNEITRLYQNTGNITLYSKWEINTYTITYELNGGTVTSNPSKYLVTDGIIELNKPVLSNYFIGKWYLDNTFTKEVNTLNQSLLEEVGNNITLYADYIKLEDLIFEDTNYNGDKYNYIYFGNYPQTVELDSSIINELDKLTSTNKNGYYEYNGVEYHKHTTNLYFENMLWLNGTQAINNKIYYFKVEPIKWQVIQIDGIIQVLSEYALDYSLFYSSLDDRTIDGVTIHANNYEHSDLRSFLNNEFLNRAFSIDELNLIKVTEVDNSLDSILEDYNDTFSANNTFDKIYSLSFSELLNPDYGFSESMECPNRGVLVSDFAMANYTIKFQGTNLGNWSSRSPLPTMTTNYIVVRQDRMFGETIRVNLEGVGVRPSFTFK